VGVVIHGKLKDAPAATPGSQSLTFRVKANRSALAMSLQLSQRFSSSVSKFFSANPLLVLQEINAPSIAISFHSLLPVCSPSCAAF